MSDMAPCVLHRWGLLGEWWCVDANADEEECVKTIHEQFRLPVPPALVRDRLFGGFQCELPGRRHVYLAAGRYTYMNPHLNEPMSDESRREVWKRLCEENGEPGGGPFTEKWTA